MRNNKGQFVKGSSGFTGKHTEETKKKIRLKRAKQGSNVWNNGTNNSGMKGKHHSEESRRKIGAKQKGKHNHAWKGGITPLRGTIYNTFEYRQWRSDIFTRDKYTCVWCGQKGGNLEADHSPKAFSEILNEYNIKSVDEALLCDELWNINNGRTLCRECHLTTDNYGGRIRKKKD